MKKASRISFRLAFLLFYLIFRLLFQFTVDIFAKSVIAVMFLLAIHPTASETGDFLSTGVKFRHAPEAFPYYRLFFSAWQAVPETGKARRFLFSHLPAGFGDFLRILFFRPGPVQASCGAARLATIRATWAISGIFVYSAQLCT